LSSSEGVIVGVTVNQSNFLGTGNQVSLNLNTGKVNTTYSFSFTDPYYTPDGVSRGFDLYRKDVDTNSLDIGSYSTKSYGAGIRFGVPLNERDAFNAGLTLDYTQLDLSSDSPQRYIDYCSGDVSGCDNLMLRLDLGWTHDTRDSLIYIQNGVVQKLTGEIGLPGLDQEYYKVSYQHTWYKQFAKYFTISLNGEAGIAGTYTGGIYPFFKNFYAGGVSSVRGFDTSSLGPHGTQLVNGVNEDFAIGGTRRVVGNVEVYSPVPYLWDNKQFRLSAFVDAGTVWGGGGDTANTPGTCNGASDCLRYSTGAAISWQSPFGPLKLVYAMPLNDKSGDHVENIQFQLGTGF
jgi:outer membrane protein insertion porin family